MSDKKTVQNSSESKADRIARIASKLSHAMTIKPESNARRESRLYQGEQEVMIGSLSDSQSD